MSRRMGVVRVSASIERRCLVNLRRHERTGLYSEKRSAPARGRQDARAVAREVGPRGGLAVGLFL